MDNRPATIFCDIDGTLVIHSKPTDAQLPSHKLTLLEGTLEKLLEWDKLGYKIILTTGRKESLRKTFLFGLVLITNQLLLQLKGLQKPLILMSLYNAQIL